jgi:hypothetical protein
MPAMPSVKLHHLFDLYDKQDEDRDLALYCNAKQKVCSRIKEELEQERFLVVARNQNWPTTLSCFDYRSKVLRMKPDIDAILKDYQGYRDTTAWVLLLQH